MTRRTLQNSYPCPECSLTFESYDPMRRHLLKVHRDGHECKEPGCDKIFTHFKDLDKHQAKDHPEPVARVRREMFPHLPPMDFEKVGGKVVGKQRRKEVGQDERDKGGEDVVEVGDSSSASPVAPQVPDEERLATPSKQRSSSKKASFDSIATRVRKGPRDSSAAATRKSSVSAPMNRSSRSMNNRPHEDFSGHHPRENSKPRVKQEDNGDEDIIHILSSEDTPLKEKRAVAEDSDSDIKLIKKKLKKTERSIKHVQRTMDEEEQEYEKEVKKLKKNNKKLLGMLQE